MRASPGGDSRPSPRFLAVGGTRSRPPAADGADLEVGGRAVPTTWRFGGGQRRVHPSKDSPNGIWCILPEKGSLMHPG